MTNEEHTDNAQGATHDAERRRPKQKSRRCSNTGTASPNYGPDELVTDAHGNPISVVDAMLSAKDAAKATETSTPAPVLLLTAHSRQHRFGHPPVRRDGNDSAPGGNLWVSICAIPSCAVRASTTMTWRMWCCTRISRIWWNRCRIRASSRSPRTPPSCTPTSNTSRPTSCCSVRNRATSPIRWTSWRARPACGRAGASADASFAARPSNLTNCASIAIYEAWRQLNFATGVSKNSFTNAIKRARVYPSVQEAGGLLPLRKNVSS